MAFWEISINGGAWTALSDLPASVAERRLTSRGIDRVLLGLPTIDYAAASPFTIDEPVAIRRDGTVWFRGRCTQPAARAATGTDHSIQAEISGPWWDLDHLPFLQTWQSYEGGDPVFTTASHSRVQIGVSDGQSRLHTMEVIGDAIAAAVALGAVIAPPTSYPPGLYVPVISGRDMSCADVIQAMLRWHPDIATSIDYTVTPPRLQLHPRATATAITRSAADHHLASNQIRPRHDLQVAGVLIRWEQSVQDPDGNSRLRLVEDKWPTSHTVGFRTLVHTMVVDGGALDPSALDNQPAGQTRPPGATPHRQRIKTRTIPAPAAVDEAAKRWWIDRIPVLAHYAGELDIEDIILPAAAGGDEEAGTDFVPHDVEIIQDGQEEPPPWQLPDESNAVPEAETDIEQYPRELVSGELPEWRNDLRVIPMSAEATIAMRKTALDALAGRKGQRLRRLFARTITIADVDYGAISLTTQFLGTNAQTRVYRGIASFDGDVPDPGDPPAAPPLPPTGEDTGALAKPLYEARSVLQWEGTWVEVFDELPPTPWTARVLNIADPTRTEWATMRAQIVEAVEDIPAGRLTLTLGPHEHLGPQDLQTLRSLARDHQRPETAPAHPGPVLAEMRFDSQAQPEAAETAPVLGARETPRRSTQGETSSRPPPPAPLEIRWDSVAEDGVWVYWGVVDVWPRGLRVAVDHDIGTGNVSAVDVTLYRDGESALRIVPDVDGAPIPAGERRKLPAALGDLIYCRIEHEWQDGGEGPTEVEIVAATSPPTGAGVYHFHLATIEVDGTIIPARPPANLVAPILDLETTSGGSS